MVTERFLRNKSGARLEPFERLRLEAAVSEVQLAPSRKTIVRASVELHQSTLLIDGLMSRYIDDHNGLRQLVAIHVPGDFVDLHAYPLRKLDHEVQTMTSARVAIVPHRELDLITREMPSFARKLWFATLLDAAIHRAWLFRLGRLDAVGRVAHFLCEMNARLMSVGLSDGRRFGLGLTQYDLAEICGLTNVHVNRVLRQLRGQGLCVFRSSQVDIPDPRRLATRGQFDPAYLYIEQVEHAPQAPSIKVQS